MDNSNLIYEESIEVKVPPEGVFSLLTSGERLLQLHPDWGKERLEGFSERYPQIGGSFSSVPLKSEEAPYITRVVAYIPHQHFELNSEDVRHTNVEFKLESSENGTLVTCCLEWEIPSPSISSGESNNSLVEGDESSVDSELADTDHLGVTVAEEARFLVHEWLTAIKRYAELGDRWLDRLMKWLMDRLLLRLRADQRRIILMLFVFQVITFITFVTAAIGLGLAALILKLGQS